MTNQLINVPQGFAGASLPAVFQGVGGADELSAGVTGGFGIVTYKGKVWRTKYRGDEKVMFMEDGLTPRAYIDVVIVKAAAHISKIFYESGFVEGSSSPPDCWSVNGIAPDPAASKKQSNTCAGCKQNAWGSKITEAGKAAKACMDNKRLAIVPGVDIRNEAFGGPMMLRVPAASLQDMATFGREMEAKGFPYYTFVTRIMFDPNEAFPKFIFSPVRPLTEEEAKLVVEQRNDLLTQRILEAAVVEVVHEGDAAAGTPTAASLFTPEAAAAVKAAAEPAAAPVTPSQAPPVMAAVEQTMVAAKPTRPKFDPETGQPIVYPDEKPARPKFDPMTGQPIVYPDEQQAVQTQPSPPPAGAVFPDVPQTLVRKAEPKAAPKVAEPTTAAAPPKDPAKAEEFEAALDNLLKT